MKTKKLLTLLLMIVLCGAILTSMAFAASNSVCIYYKYYDEATGTYKKDMVIKSMAIIQEDDKYYISAGALNNIMEGKVAASSYGDRIQIYYYGWSAINGKEFYYGNSVRNPARYGGPDNYISFENEEYTVTYAAGDGGSGTMEAGKATAFTSFTLPSCTFTAPENKEFKAWSVNGTEYEAGAEYTFTDDTTVTAVWKDIPVHEHNTELRNAKEATKTQKGYTGDLVCKDCGDVIQYGTEIPMLPDTNKSESPKTGDDCNMLFYMILAMVGFVCTVIGVVCVKKKKSIN